MIHQSMMLGVLGVCVGAAWAQPTVDGVFAEWGPATLLASDPVGDGASPFDVTAVHAQSRGTALFLMLDVEQVSNLQSGPSGQPTIRVVVKTLGATPRTLTIDCRLRRANIDGVLKTWPELDFASQPTVSSDRWEIRVDLAALGVAVGETVAINVSGADVLASDALFTLSEPAVVAVRRAWTRRACTEVRVASLNTFVNGLITTARVPQFRRLVDAVDADIYLFQEEYNSTAAQVKAFMDAADPKDDGVPWNVVKSGELAIASQHPLLAVSLENRHYGAVVRLPGLDVLAVSVHSSCCGFAGSTEDSSRITQAQNAIARLGDFRAGTISPQLAPFAGVPAVVGGDWNLVGSSTPVDLWVAAGGPGMARTPMPQLIGSDVATWYAPSGTDFWPGVLDLFVHSAARGGAAGLFPKNTFVLRSEMLDGGELAALGLLAGDSAASDHKLLVADFGRRGSADVNGDGVVDLVDFFEFFECYDVQAACANVDADPAVDLADFFAFFEAWDGQCP